MRIAEELGLSKDQLYDIVALSILHDNGASDREVYEGVVNKESVNSFEKIKKHCIIGEYNVIGYPFITDIKNVIKYHHEHYDGSGFFNIKGKDIPIMAQIISFSDLLERNFDLKNNDDDIKNKIYNFINKYDNKLFSSIVAKAFNKMAMDRCFWERIKSENLTKIIIDETPEYTIDLSLDKIHNITKVFSKVIDSKSNYTKRHSGGLSEKAARMADYYKYDNDIKMKLIIAADLHDLGKLAISNEILDIPRQLTDEEFNTIKKHTYYTRLALQEIDGFEEITEWASNHHEKLNGSGYPFGFTDERLDFNSRLVSCLDIYQALTEERPYRRSLSHKEAMNILNNMRDEGFIDSKIADDINEVFRQ